MPTDVQRATTDLRQHPHAQFFRDNPTFEPVRPEPTAAMPPLESVEDFERRVEDVTAALYATRIDDLRKVALYVNDEIKRLEATR